MAKIKKTKYRLEYGAIGTPIHCAQKCKMAQAPQEFGSCLEVKLNRSISQPSHSTPRDLGESPENICSQKALFTNINRCLCHNIPQIKMTQIYDI